MISLPVSIGEALDKLTILEIKLEVLKDDKKKEVEKELESLKPILEPFFKKNELFLKLLKEINQKLWEWCEKCRGDRSDLSLCKNIIEYNDYRFIVKNKINLNTGSFLKEQKSYPKRKAIIFSHLGLGDQITTNAAVRYFSSQYDELLVVGKYKHHDTLEFMYRDDPSVGIIYVYENMDLCPVMDGRRAFVRLVNILQKRYQYTDKKLSEKTYLVFTGVSQEGLKKASKESEYILYFERIGQARKEGKDVAWLCAGVGYYFDKSVVTVELLDLEMCEETSVIKSGKDFLIRTNYSDHAQKIYDYFVSLGYQFILSGCNIADNFCFSIPFFYQIYTDMKLDWNVRYRYFYAQRDFEREKKCLAVNGLDKVPYVFVHNDENEGKLYPKIDFEKELYYYHPNQSVDPKLEKIWEGNYTNIFDYCSIIENAQELIVKDSCFFCLATNLDLSKVKKLSVYPRAGDDILAYLEGSPQRDKWIIAK